jgi:hypothetical protein
MNDLSARLRDLADRLDAVDLSAYVRTDLSREYLMQQIDEMEYCVVLFFGTGEAMPEGEIRAHASAVSTSEWERAGRLAGLVWQGDKWVKA